LGKQGDLKRVLASKGRKTTILVRGDRNRLDDKKETQVITLQRADQYGTENHNKKGGKGKRIYNLEPFPHGNGAGKTGQPTVERKTALTRVRKKQRETVNPKPIGAVGKTPKNSKRKSVSFLCVETVNKSE